MELQAILAIELLNMGLAVLLGLCCTDATSYERVNKIVNSPSPHYPRFCGDGKRFPYCDALPGDISADSCAKIASDIEYGA